ncbi:MAG TPA: polyphenol oxidase family protein, partial [Patescibacteria group bacterium]
MLLKNNVFKFNNFSSYPDLVHGISTRFFGSMRPKHEEFRDSMQKFADELGIMASKIVTMGQVHTNNIQFVSTKNWGQAIPQTDGLMTTQKNVFLGVVIADCVPLLIYDHKQKFTSVIHAGWRGLFNEIIKETVSALVAKGSNPQNLLVGIGPCIRSCHYNITDEHRTMLIEQSPEWERFI